MSASLTTSGAVSAAPDQTLLAGDMDGVALSVLIFLFLVVTVLAASRPRAGASPRHGVARRVGPRRSGFGTWITWFLLGGDLYTAYTFVAVPAAMYATGASAGSSRCPTRSWSTR